MYERVFGVQMEEDMEESEMPGSSESQLPGHTHSPSSAQTSPSAQMGHMGQMGPGGHEVHVHVAHSPTSIHKATTPKTLFSAATGLACFLLIMFINSSIYARVLRIPKMPDQWAGPRKSYKRSGEAPSPRLGKIVSKQILGKYVQSIIHITTVSKSKRNFFR